MTEKINYRYYASSFGLYHDILCRDTIRMRKLQLFGHTLVFNFIICRMPADVDCLEWSRVSVVREDPHEDGLMTF